MEKNKRALIFAIFLIIIVVGLGVVNSFFGWVTIEIPEVNSGEGATTYCESDKDCLDNEVCFEACGVCGSRYCDYDGCQGGDGIDCCSEGLGCNFYSECMCLSSSILKSSDMEGDKNSFWDNLFGLLKG